MIKIYSLKRSRKILRSSFHLFQKKKNRLESVVKDEIESKLRKLDQALIANERTLASELAKEVELLTKKHIRKNPLDFIKEFFVAITFALIAAYIIRMFWFELYEVPTGSMRPTIQEQDRLLVSKTTFGFHDPFLLRGSAFFDKDQLVREGLIVFTVRGMDVRDNKALYFGLIPGLKQLVKRSPTLPGDTIYFYGGTLYGVDASGASFSNPLNTPQLDYIEHIPIVSFEGEAVQTGRISEGYYSESLLRQFHQPVARLKTKNNGWTHGEFFDGENWREENLSALKKPHERPEAYADLWGIGNYAMVRMLTIKEAKQFYQKDFPFNEHEGLLLELHHTPSVSFPLPEIRRSETGVFAPTLTPMTTLIALSPTHLQRVMEGMTTARFYVKNGSAYRYTESATRPQNPRLDIPMPGVPDGCYEFYRGQGYAVHFGGFRSKLSNDHPLCSKTAENIRTLFNFGTYFNRVFEPIAPIQPYVPQRYAYWKEGDLFVMGTPIFLKEEAETEAFITREKQKQEQSASLAPYIAFVDRGPPIKEGKVDIAFIQKFGLKIPDDSLIALGDNYAGSGDSRSFGFVPLKNLRGSPVFTFWPLSSRFGFLTQPGYAYITIPNLISWTIALIVFVSTVIYTRNRRRRSLFKD